MDQSDNLRKNSFSREHISGFGENLTLAGMDEDSVCIGDIVRLGSSRLQVSQPGQFDQLSFLRSAEKAFAVAARHTKRTGWYYRVLEQVG